MAKAESLEKQAAHGAKWDQLSREQQDYLAEKVPEMYGSSPRKPFSPGTLSRRVEDAQAFLRGEPAQDDERGQLGKVLRARNLEDDVTRARAALSPKQNQIRPPTAEPERESFKIKQEFADRETAAGILEIPETELNSYCIRNNIGFKSNGSGGLVFSSKDILAHATKHGLIQKTKVREYLDNHGGQ